MKILLIFTLLLCSCGVTIRKIEQQATQNINLKDKTVLIYRSSTVDQYMDNEDIESFKDNLYDTNLFGKIDIERNELEYDYYIDFKFINRPDICNNVCMFLENLKAVPSLFVPFWYQEKTGYVFILYNKDHIKIANINTVGTQTVIDWSLGYTLRLLPSYVSSESAYLKNEILLYIK